MLVLVPGLEPGPGSRHTGSPAAGFHLQVHIGAVIRPPQPTWSRAGADDVVSPGQLRGRGFPPVRHLFTLRGPRWGLVKHLLLCRCHHRQHQHRMSYGCYGDGADLILQVSDIQMFVSISPWLHLHICFFLGWTLSDWFVLDSRLLVGGPGPGSCSAVWVPVELPCRGLEPATSGTFAGCGQCRKIGACGRFSCER